MPTCPNCRLDYYWKNHADAPYCCRICREKGGTRGVSQIGACIHCAERALAVDTEQSPGMEAVYRALFLLDLGSAEDRNTVLSLRQVCSGFRSMIKHFATFQLGKGSDVVISDVLFMCAFADEFSDFRKDSVRARTVTARDSFRHGYTLYLNVRLNVVQRQGRPCYIELFPEKKVLFPKRLATGQSSSRRKPETIANTEWTNGQLFNPRGVWTPEINDSWALGNIHAGQDFRLMAQIDALQNFWDGDYQRPTALGRELIQICRAGYQPVMVDQSTDRFKGFGVLFKAPSGAILAPVEDLANAKYSTFDELKMYLAWIARQLSVGRRSSASSSRSVTMPNSLTGVRSGPRLDPDTGDPMT